jgi:hypothetical protein
MNSLHGKRGSPTMTESNQGSESEIQLKSWIESALDQWLWILGLALLGALLGLLVSKLRPPIYEAEAILGMSINYGITEPLELVVEDRSLGRAEAFVLSNNVFEDIFSKIPEGTRAERDWITPLDLYQDIRLDRRLGEWGLVVKDEDPQVAADVSRLWAETTISHLDEAMQHAWRAAVLLGGEFDVECTYISGEDVTTEVWQCQVLPLEFDPITLEGELQTEVELSHGILPILSYELLRYPVVPTKPAVWGRGELILGGALAGLLLGFILSVILPRRRTTNESGQRVGV